MKKINTLGFSLIEVLVVIGLFSVIGVIATSSTADSIRGTKKSDATIRLRSNLELALTTMERNIRNSKEVPVCTGESSSTIDYTDNDNIVHTFSCTSGTLQLDGEDITSQEVSVTDCSFTCTPAGIGVPPSVEISIKGQDALSSGEQSAELELSSKVNLRAY